MGTIYNDAHRRVTDCHGKRYPARIISMDLQSPYPIVVAHTKGPGDCEFLDSFSAAGYQLGGNLRIEDALVIEERFFNIYSDTAIGSLFPDRVSADRAAAYYKRTKRVKITHQLLPGTFYCAHDSDFYGYLRTKPEDLCSRYEG